MIDFSKWRERSVAATSLLLDPKNPRLPSLREDPSQRDVAAELVRHEDVYELARDIANLGYFPTEILIAVEEGSDIVVVEGNRRLAAVKILLAPEFGPDDFVRKFQALHDRVNQDAIRKLTVTLAPSREAAAPLIINRHTRTGVERWQPAQQAKYIRTLITPDVSLDDLAKELGLSKAELVDSIKADTMYQVACELDLPDDIRSKVRNPRTFAASVIDRLIHAPKVLHFLGITFDDTGNLIGTVAKDEFIKGYTRIVTDVAVGKQDTRTLNTALQIEQYLKSVGKDAPNLKRKGSFTAESLLGDASAKVTAPAQPRIKTGPKRESSSVIPRGFKCNTHSPRINDIFRELKKLRVSEMTNAVGVLLRIFVELIVGYYLDRTKKIAPLLQKAKKDNKPSDWYPTLRHMMKAVMEDGDITVPPLARKGLNKMVSNDEHPFSLDNLDQFVHNRYVGPSERELRRYMALLEPLLEQLLEKAELGGKAN